MKQVYSPTNSAEAHMLAHQLELAGIKAHIHGEALQGGVGELPAGGLLQLLVADEDYDAARRLLKSWEETAPADAAATPAKFPTFLALAFFAVGVFGGWVGKVAVDQSHITVLDAQDQLDTNGDGREDLTYFFRLGGAYAHRMDADNNYDDRVDLSVRYDPLGIAESQTQDLDFDGSMEAQSTFRHGVLRQTRIDTNGNNVPDITQTFENGVLAREEIFDERAGELARINYYEAGQLKRSESDLDRDGAMETQRTYDRYGEVVNIETRAR